MMVKWNNPSEVRKQQVENVVRYFKEAISNCFMSPNQTVVSLRKGIQISQVLMDSKGHKRIHETERLITQLGNLSLDELRQLWRECKENTDTILECYVGMLEWEKPVPTVAMAYVIDRLRSEEKILAAIEARFE